MSSRLINAVIAAWLALPAFAATPVPPTKPALPQADKGFVCTDKYDRKHLVVQAFEQALRSSDDQIKPVVPSSWNDFKNPDDSIGFDLGFIGKTSQIAIEVKHLPQVADKLLSLNPVLKQQLSAPLPALLCMRTADRKLFVQLVGVGAVAPYVGAPVEIRRSNTGIITASLGALGLTWNRDITRLRDEETSNVVR